ncbi:hypothetical protein CR513_49389, partial [Mucuna pruriens]
ICSTVRKTYHSRYLDNGCSRHITIEKSMFGGNKKGRITGISKIGEHPFSSIDNVLFIEGLKHNLLSINYLKDLTNLSVTCLVSIKDDQWIWHKKLGHASLRLTLKLSKHHLKGKQVKGFFESKNIVSTSKSLELLQIDRFGPTRTVSMSGK